MRLNRALLRLVNWRLRSDIGDGFMGGLVQALAARIRERGEEVDAQKALEQSIARVALRTVALDTFVKLNTGEAARQ
jgi:hypothetical protein